MAGKKPVSATKFRRVQQARAKRASADAKKRAQHYSKGDKLIKQVSKTLKQVAASHPQPKAKRQAKLAIQQLKQAHAAFGNAGMCQEGGSAGGGTTFDNK